MKGWQTYVQSGKSRLTEVSNHPQKPSAFGTDQDREAPLSNLATEDPKGFCCSNYVVFLFDLEGFGRGE